MPVAIETGKCCPDCLGAGDLVLGLRGERNENSQDPSADVAPNPTIDAQSSSEHDDVAANTAGRVDARRYAGGDLQGILGKADYLGSLGITDVWLSPIFQSETSHGYDVMSYYRVGDAVAVPGDAEASLELFRRAGDSLAGRFFLCNWALRTRSS